MLTYYHYSIFMIYYWKMIKSYSCKETEKVHKGLFSKKWDNNIRRKGQMKLDILDTVRELDHLRIPPGNRLHPLKDDLIGYHSISINKQWRIIFKWKDGDAYEVKIKDYH